MVGAAFQHVLLSGVSLSREFEQGGARHGALPGLVPGWILGHRMVGAPALHGPYRIRPVAPLGAARRAASATLRYPPPLPLM